MKRIFAFVMFMILLMVAVKVNAGINDGLVAYFPFEGSADDVKGGLAG